MYPAVYKGTGGSYPIVMWGPDDVDCLLIILLLIAILLLMLYIRLLQ